MYFILNSILNIDEALAASLMAPSPPPNLASKEGRRAYGCLCVILPTTPGCGWMTSSVYHPPSYQDAWRTMQALPPLPCCSIHAIGVRSGDPSIPTNICNIRTVHYRDRVFSRFDFNIFGNIKDFSFSTKTAGQISVQFLRRKNLLMTLMHLTAGSLEVNSPVCFSDFVLFSGIDAFSYWLLKLRLYLN